MEPENPYVIGNSVGNSDAFVGRADILREVSRVLRHYHQNAIVLFGQRRIGKTSLLRELEAKLPKEGAYFPIYFDLLDKAQQPLQQVLLELAQKISQGWQKGKPDLGTAPETTFREVWLPDLLKTNLPPDKSLVLLFDEFDVLADPKSEQAGAAFFPYLRDLLTIDPKRLNFVFVIGRKVDDLAHIALSLFKGIPSKAVSLLNREDTIKLVRLSETNNSLNWTDGAIEKVWQLTSGHPYLTQALCSRVWENIYDNKPDDEPTVTLIHVETAISDTLATSDSAFRWLWDGLPPAERLVISALATDASAITKTQLEDHLLHNSEVPVGCLKMPYALRLLQEWDLIELVKGCYRFRVELLRRWIAKNKPLSFLLEECEQVKKQTDIREQTDIHYETASRLYNTGHPEEAIKYLSKAVLLEPYHKDANQLLAKILIQDKQSEEARQVLERLYEEQPDAACDSLISVLLDLARSSEREHGQQAEEEQLKFYQRILEINAKHPEAKDRWQNIWQRRGNKELGVVMDEDFEQALVQASDNALDNALEKYREGELHEKIKKIEMEQHRRTMLAGWYQQAKVALRNGDKQKAEQLLIQVINAKPNYEEAAKYLKLAVTDSLMTRLTLFLAALDRKFFITSATAVVLVVVLVIVGGLWWSILPDTLFISEDVPGSEVGIKPQPIEQPPQLVTKPNTLTQIIEQGFISAAFRSDFSYIEEETNKLVGFDVDILHEFARRWFQNENTEKAVKLIPMTTTHYVDSLINQEVNIATSSLTESLNMNENIDFSINYFQDSQRLLVRKDAGITDVCKLKGKKLAVIKSSTAKNLQNSLKDKCGFTIEIEDKFQNNSEVIEALKKQEVAAFVTTYATALKLLLEVHSDFEATLEIVEYELDKEFYRFAMPKDDGRFLKLVNMTLREMESDGTYARIYCKWFVTKPSYTLKIPASINDVHGLEKMAKANSSSSFQECYPIEYIVQKGDTLSELAKIFYGESTFKYWDHIFNNEKNKKTGVLIDNSPDRQINAGKKLWIPKPP
jgi:ABC-type amino acid transport substrate-binding protein